MNNSSCPVNKKRACAKIALVAVLVLAALVALVTLMDGQVMDEIKHTLSLWTIVALVVVINLVSFVCFIVLYAAYRWVRRDLKPPRDAELDL
jgi:amino acid transporter